MQCIFCQADTYQNRKDHHRATIEQAGVNILIFQGGLLKAGSYGRFFQMFMLSVIRPHGKCGMNERLFFEDCL
jgi:hypothetical protein